MNKVNLTASGLFKPKLKISNEELVTAFNKYVDIFNHKNQQDIKDGKIEALEYSSTSFIEKASGIKSRYVIEKEGLLDPSRMRPYFNLREDDQASLQCEVAAIAINQALDAAQKSPKDVDGVIAACSNFQRAYPAIAIEIQNEMKFNGFAFDMNVACSSATFAIAMAYNLIKTGQNNCVVVVNPEICSGQLDFTNRDSHFIFGDVCTAVIVEKQTDNKGFEILSCKLATSFSNNIRNNTGFLNRCEIPRVDTETDPRYIFKQNGRKVFKEVIPLACEHIQNHLQDHKLASSDIKRLWLHQANINMNNLIAKKLLDCDPSFEQAPVILDKYANTGSAGSVVAFHEHSDDFSTGNIGVLSSFGAGYSVGSVILQKN